MARAAPGEEKTPETKEEPEKPKPRAAIRWAIPTVSHYRMFIWAYRTGRAILGKAMKELLSRWSDTRAEWNDVMSRNFEKNRLEPMETDLRSANQAMDAMAQILNQARRDCQ